jgi:hypothetical protein
VVTDRAANRTDISRPRQLWPGWDPDLDTPPSDGPWDDPTRYPWQ